MDSLDGRGIWRTIDSAPKDGTAVMVVWQDLDGHEHQGACWNNGTGWYPFNRTATYWHPLQPLPSTSPQPAPSSLFQLGEFTLASGAASAWKIECDALTPADWAALARMAVEVIPPFGSVEGVPRGGIPFADALRPYATQGPLLIAEDVVTTGASMNRHLSCRGAFGVAVFARGAPPAWVRPLFAMAQPAPSDGKEDGSSGVASPQEQTSCPERPEDLWLDEGVLSEALERSIWDCGSMGSLSLPDIPTPLINILGRHLSHHIKDVAREFSKSSEVQPECSERSDDPTLSGTNNKPLRPHARLRSPTSATFAWEEINSLFRVHGLAPPPFPLRDELVMHLLWARYAEQLEDNKTSDGWMQEVVEVLTEIRDRHGFHEWALLKVSDLIFRLRGASHG